MQQKTLEFRVDAQRIRAPRYAVVSDSKNYLSARFSFDETWQGLTKTAVFQGPDGRAYHVLLADDTCMVPPEVICPTRFFVAVFGGDRLTTDRATVEVEASGCIPGVTPPLVTPDIYEQLAQKVETERQLAEASADMAAETAEQLAEELDAAHVAASAATAAAEAAVSTAEQVAAQVQQCAYDAADAREAAESAQQDAISAAQVLTAAQTCETQAQASAESAEYAAAVAQTAADEASAAAAAAKGYVLLSDITLTEDVKTILVSRDMAGNPFVLKKLKLLFMGHVTQGVSHALALRYNDGAIYQFYKGSFIDNQAADSLTVRLFYAESERVHDNLFVGSGMENYGTVILPQTGNFICQGLADNSGIMKTYIGARDTGLPPVTLIRFGITGNSEAYLLAGSRIQMYAVLEETA